MLRRLPVLALALAAGCAPRLAARGEPRTEAVTVGEAQVRIRSWPEDADAAAQVARAVRLAVPRTARWGGLAGPVTITVHPTHQALEVAVSRPGHGWLRAWARADTIDLQSPSTWRFLGARDEQVVEVLVHELTHCAMYQRARTPWRSGSLGFPLWFGEGMASVTAAQGHRRGTVEGLWSWYRQPLPRADPLGDPEPLYRDRSDLVYGAAHHAFLFLLARYGEARVGQLLDRMHAGLAFGPAFTEVMGIEEAAFTADFRRYVAWQGWRR